MGKQQFQQWLGQFSKKLSTEEWKQPSIEDNTTQEVYTVHTSSYTIPLGQLLSKYIKLSTQSKLTLQEQEFVTFVEEELDKMESIQYKLYQPGKLVRFEPIDYMDIEETTTEEK